MTRSEAINRYITESVQRQEIVRRIMLWNPTKTVKENCIAMKLNHHSSSLMSFVKQYKLKYKKLDWGGRRIKHDR